MDVTDDETIVECISVHKLCRFRKWFQVMQEFPGVALVFVDSRADIVARGSILQWGGQMAARTWDVGTHSHIYIYTYIYIYS